MRVLLNLFTVVLLSLSLFSIKVQSSDNIQFESSPYLELKSVGNQLFSRIAANQKEIKKFPLLMRDIVEEELMPSIDYRYASYKILGKHLKKTTKAQRAEFSEAMRRYLVRTYATALTKYKNQQVIFEADKPTKGKKIVSVKTQIVDLNAPTIDVIFKMRQNKKTGQWKAFDMVVEGISLLSSKKAELSKKIAKQGVEQVTLELAVLTK
ncbi:MlaC/ttg2D family ABC transporter substrate-binding protein [Litorilituus lipolyticus]|uniref:ABC transporter substrate-binding protein n=1 Tax=Litorilituus lipolyticus TaxID=2491017 RepID=A0A502KZJ6_9GAMM|nr:ABC transporter substrate-binding protein [Litorilituus lipolyticus]TPH15605.1 ABC transporter substrate-binding protein [Litorilituus lipolyticus]